MTFFIQLFACLQMATNYIYGITVHIQWGMLQRTNATTNSFYQLNQDDTTNAEEYYRPT